MILRKDAASPVLPQKGVTLKLFKLRIAKQSTIKAEIDEARELVRCQAEAEITLLNETHRKYLEFQQKAMDRSERIVNIQMDKLARKAAILTLIEAKLPSMNSVARREIEGVFALGKNQG